MSAVKFQKIGHSMRTAYGSTPFVAGGAFIDGIQHRAYKLEKRRHFEQQFGALCAQVNPELLTAGNMRKIASMISKQMEQEVQGRKESSAMLTTSFIPGNEPCVQAQRLADVLQFAWEATDVQWQLRERPLSWGHWPFRRTVWRYQVLYPQAGFEYQVINMSADGEEARHWVTANEAIAYLWGAIGQVSSDAAQFVPPTKRHE